MKHLLTIFLFIIIPSGVWAEFMSPDGKTIADTEYRKSMENFGAQLVITNKEELFPENWNAPSKGVYFPTIYKIQKGEISPPARISMGIGLPYRDAASISSCFC